MKGKKVVKFGFDIDDVIIDSYSVILKYLENECNIKLNPPVYGGESSASKFNIHLPIAELKRLINKALLKNNDMLPISGSLEFLSKYYQYSNYLCFITSRPKILIEATNQLLFYYLGNDVNFKIFFPMAMNKTKSSIVESEEIDVFIDDMVKYCMDVSNKGIQSLLFSQPWNEYFYDPLCCHNIKRVNDWVDINNFFDRTIGVFYD